MSLTVLHAVTLGHGSAWEHSQPIEGQQLSLDVSMSFELDAT